jgi:hypothetical protein
MAVVLHTEALLMSINGVVDFWRSVQTNPELTARLSAIVEQANDDAYVAGAEIAREKGFEVTPEEMNDVGSVVAFWNRVERDESLRNKLGPAREMETADLAMREITKIANGAGFAFSPDALQYVTGALVNAGRATAAPAEGSRMSEEELEGVAGGVAALETSLDLARRKLWHEDMTIGPGVIGAKP